MRTATDERYRLTAAGRQALQSQNSVPGWYRSILWLAQGEPSRRAIRNALYSDSPKQVDTWLDEMETLGFLDRVHNVEPLAEPQAA